MDYRKIDVSKRLTDWLDQLAIPFHLRDKPDAAQKEAETLLRILLKFSPREDYIPFINRVCDYLDNRMKQRTWPTPHDIGAACANIAKDTRKEAGSEDQTDMSAEAITGRRMAAGEAVGEGWLYGRQAVDLIGAGHVTREVMERYRSGAFLARRSAYGDIAARQWEDDAKARHELAKNAHRERNSKTERQSYVPAINRMEYTNAFAE